MITVKGKFNEAIIYTDNCEENAIAQVKALCDLEVYKDCKIRIMPDVHVGKFCPIGTTIELKGKVIPYTVGIDIGCGVTSARFKPKKLELEKLDKVIRTNIPSGMKIRSTEHRFSDQINLEELKCFKHIKHDKALLSLGTLGGGNHFIEIDKDVDGYYHIIVHSGSRHLGVEVAEYYQNKAKEYNRSLYLNTPFEFCWLEGELFDDYIHDMKIVQQFANLNRLCIIDEVCRAMKFNMEEIINVNHNYIDDSNILRKGAISASDKEPILIPINMKDGVITGLGKGNPDWNYSAPHGSGRNKSKTDVANNYTVSSYKKEMKGIYCSVISKGTLEESPFAYRRLEDIIENVSECISVRCVLKPVYNYKAERKK